MSATANAADGRWLAALDRWVAPVENTANFLAGLAIFILMFMGTTQIFLRTLFNTPIPGYIDLVQLAMASMAFLGAAYCQRLSAHIRMELLVGNLKGRALWGFEIVTTLVSLFIIAVLIVYGWDHFMRSYLSGDTTIDAEYMVWPSKLLVPVAFSLWFVRLLIQLAGAVRLFIDPTCEPVGIAKIHDPAELASEEIRETFGGELPGGEGIEGDRP
ncbi:TRAP transporter small permease [Rhizobiaceae bacterium]|nr:TRAP transporter small permease [Rhizobiaceae bacterium]